MIKNQKKALIFLVGSFLLAIVLEKAVVKTEPSENLKNPSQVFTDVVEKKSKSPNAPVVSESASSETKENISWQTPLKKCFPNADIKDVERSKLPEFFEKRTKLTSPALELERYELESKEDTDLVVQYIPNEETKNQVRVFSISKEDGLPDRIYDFPNSTSVAEKKLEGALSLGKIVNKEEAFRQDGANGETLEVEKSKNIILKVRYSEPGIEFTCDEIKCECLTIQN